ncbi:glycerophosphodiester phosphodiesterase [Alkalicoccobacillus murimartini]|uniref:Glycerophosphoryl diester phosphodiesterase n=1 Tax=Alkalicoccobacillus murimartini TaxID=171685 RepID=A0ABT9YKG1_9BACI|nr:glycerophosphodiester phosphodiesterase [Alkalicoccobacillus murimartini]MDQ0208226.1 glycerophosphoryl diester phosphodiesterase [Alkalicoccobacillus murimartini]
MFQKKRAKISRFEENKPRPIIQLNEIEKLPSTKALSSGILLSWDIVQELTLEHIHQLMTTTCTIVFHIENEERFRFIHESLISHQYSKIAIISSDRLILREARNQLPLCEPILQINEYSWNTNEFIAYVNVEGIRTVWLQPDHAVALSKRLHKHAISVWSHGENARDMHRLHVAGVDAITCPIEHDSAQLFDAYQRLHLLERPVFVAHRGAPQLDAENTLAAFEKAVELGADVLETDIRETKDKKLILFHDPDINRTTSKKGFVSSYTLNQLKDIHPVVELETFLKHYQHSPQLLLIEIKERHTVLPIVRMVESLQMEQRVHIQSFDPVSLTNVQTLNRSIGISLLYTHNKWSKNQLSQAKVKQTLKHTQASLNVKMRRVPRRLNMNDSSVHLRMFTWTLTTKKELYMYWSLGFSGLITDCIQHIKNVPLELEAQDLPILNKNPLHLPNQAVACYADGSKRLVEVSWLVQYENQLINLTDEFKQQESVDVCCIHQFNFNGKKRSILSDLTTIHDKNKIER